MKVNVSRNLRKKIVISYNNNQLDVKSYLFVSRKRIKQCLSENGDRIMAFVGAENAKANSNHLKPDCCQNGDTFTDNTLMQDMFIGKKTLICGDVVSVLPSVNTKTYIDGNTLFVNDKLYKNKYSRLKCIKSYLKKLSIDCVCEEISGFGTGIGVCPTKIAFCDCDRWCDCKVACQQGIALNFKICQLPQRLRRLVIAHAFAHFKYKSHNEQFDDYLSILVDDSAKLTQQLQQYDFLLNV